jgi:hypothetical protein
MMVDTRSRSGAPRLSQRPLSRGLRVYQKIAIVFVVMSFLLLLGVLYLSISSATIFVTPTAKVVSATVPIDLTSNPSLLGQAGGVVLAESFTKAKQFNLPAEGGTPVEAKSSLKVTLINETSSTQPLVVNTRLLSEEGILFRLDGPVNIPANGQLDTTAHADLPGASGDIAPSQFTIPGLPANLQDDIYAVSVEPASGGVSYIHVVSQANLDEAEKELTQEILSEAKLAMRAKVDTKLTGDSYTVETVERVSDTPPGTQAGTFNISLTVKVTGVYFDEAALAAAAKADLVSQLPDGYDLLSVNTDGLQVTVGATNLAKGTATVSVYLDGTAVISTSSDVLDKDRLVGKSANEIITLLQASDYIQDVSITFTPFWLKRVPTLKDHIKIIVEEPAK